MGSDQTKIQGREYPPEYLIDKIQSNLQNSRLKWSHQANIWVLCKYLRQNYGKWEITEIYLQNNMIAGQVIEEISKINFEKSDPQLKVLSLSNNEVKCQSLKYFRGAYFNNLLMLYLDHNNISDDGCFYISKTNLQKLQALDLSHNLINEAGTLHLSNGNYPRLVNLIISYNNLSFTGLSNLVRGHFPSLAFVQAKNLAFEPTKDQQTLAFRTQVKMFRLELH